MLRTELMRIFKKYYGDESIPILEHKSSKSDYGTTTASSGWPGGSLLPSVEKLPKYPRGVYLVLASKFFESFAANGVRTILALYLHDSLHFSQDLATIVLHIFNFFSQFCPIIGAFLADGYIGNERSIIYFLIIYATGFLGITLTTLPLVNQSDTIYLIVYISLWLISVGNGSIRANITSLGASQFKVPPQSRELEGYFSRYYFVYTAGILLSKTVTPSIRGMTKCFGRDNCYLAVFGTLSIMFLLCFAIFLVGLIFYTKEVEQRENVLFKVIRCILESLKRKIIIHKGGTFLDNIQDIYEKEFVKSVKVVLQIIKLFLPLPIYWALLAQQDSSWTFQAAKLNTKIVRWHLEPDQMKAIAPLILLALIPLWEQTILPAIDKHLHHLITPLESVTLGGIAAAASFICAGFLEIIIQEFPPGSISVLWQLPQFTLLMVGEVLLAIPGIQFAFTQAPQSMKSVLTAAWFINNAFGNIIVVFITEWKPVQRQSLEYFLYAGLMMIGIMIFAGLADAFQRRQDSLLESEGGQ